MIERIKALLGGGPNAAMTAAPDEGQVAVAALLVEAAVMDERFDPAEQATILDLLKDRFGLDDSETADLLAAARETVAQSSQLFAFTRVVNDRFSFEERVELMEMLWQVAYADGELDDFEANLLRRVAGLIHVPDRDSGAARKRAMARLGLAAG